MSYLIYFLSSILLSKLSKAKISNCINENNDNCLQCENGYILSSNQCFPCVDQGCETCKNKNAKSCTYCKLGFQLYLSECGIQCKDISNCKICSINHDYCLQCKQNCENIAGKCNCTQRTILIFVCCLFSIVVVVIIVICLTNPKIFKKLNSTKIAIGIPAMSNSISTSVNYKNIHQGINDFNDTLKEKPTVSELISATMGSENESKIEDQKVKKKGEFLSMSSSNRNLKNSEMESIIIEKSSEDCYGQNGMIVIDSNLISPFDNNNNNNVCHFCHIKPTKMKLSCGCCFCSLDYNNIIKPIIIKGKQNTCPICKKQFD